MCERSKGEARRKKKILKKSLMLLYGTNVRGVMKQKRVFMDY